MSCSIGCDFIVLLAYIQLTLVSDWRDILTALAGWSHSVPLVLLYASFFMRRAVLLYLLLSLLGWLKVKSICVGVSVQYQVL